MTTLDLQMTVIWWLTLLLVGAVAFPITRKLFKNWYDAGYLFSKAVGLALVGWATYVLGILHLVPFSNFSIYLSLIIVLIAGIAPDWKKIRNFKFQILNSKKIYLTRLSVMIIEEIFFLAALLFWTWIKAHEPSIRGLEKFMDYGFMNSILHSQFFPPPDMWYPPSTINYYYFGHLVTAMLTKLSGLDLAVTFNLMLATIFAFCLTESFAIGYQLMSGSTAKKYIRLIAGILTAFLLTLGGNMQTIYAFTQGYDGDNVSPFWQLLWPVQDFFTRLPDGMNRYWYANATRFIPYSIHEFPSYSFVVSDVHGHVLSIPFTLLAIALVIAIYQRIAKLIPENLPVKQFFRSGLWNWDLIFYGFLSGILLMTNALDGPIYLALLSIIVAVLIYKNNLFNWKTYLIALGLIIITFVATSAPFLAFFKSFVNGVAVDCPPAYLANTKLGPLLFEGVEKCQKSAFWMMWLLWGFFWFTGLFMILNKTKILKGKFDLKNPFSRLSINLSQDELVLTIMFVFSILLLIFPELFYFKDIYPMHFRSNTMFKLGYQAFMMFSVISGYSIVKYVFNLGEPSAKPNKYLKKIFIILLIPQLFLVSIYPVFSVRSYFNSLSKYEGINGLGWIQRDFPLDFLAINWLNTRKDHTNIVEADGDSYTDYNLYSVFTGRSTIIGWAVHEWLWRGSYEVVSPRREEVRIIYESDDIAASQEILVKYKVKYIIVSTFERQKFTALNEDKINKIATPVFNYGQTIIYEVNPVSTGG